MQGSCHLCKDAAVFFISLLAGPTSFMERLVVRKKVLSIEIIKATVFSVETKIVHWKCREINCILL